MPRANKQIFLLIGFLHCFALLLRRFSDWALTKHIFPSGHAQTAFALAASLTILFPRWGVPLFVAATAVGISRIILTSHYLSDVIAGAGIGILLTMAVQYFLT